MQITYEESKVLAGLVFKQQAHIIELGAENLHLKAELRKAQEHAHHDVDSKSWDGRE